MDAVVVKSIEVDPLPEISPDEGPFVEEQTVESITVVGIIPLLLLGSVFVFIIAAVVVAIVVVLLIKKG